MSATVGESGVLHTKSSYFGNTASSYAIGGGGYNKMFDATTIEKDLQQALAYAEKQEQIFYQLYTNATTYEGFLAEIRKIFAGAHKDGEFIRNLGNANLGKFIPPGWGQGEIGQVVIKIQQNHNPLQIDLSALNTVSTSVEPGELYVTVSKESAPLIKEYMQKLLMKGAEDPEKYWSASRGYSNKSKVDFSGVSRWGSKASDKKKALSNYLQDIAEDTRRADLLKKAGIEFEVTKGKVTIEDLDEVIVPFTQYTKVSKTAHSNSIQDALKDPETKLALERTLAKVKDFIMNDCLHVREGFDYPDKGNILLKAANFTWNSIEEKIMSGIEGFFFEGINLSKGVLGAGGEFQAKLISTYLSMVTGKGALSQIVGGIIKDNRQEPRTDVQIIKELGGDMGTYIAGIQVKNVNEDTQTHLKISSDLELIAPNLPESFRDTLANSMFNIDIKNMVGDIDALLDKYLESYFWRAMNLNVHADLNPNHTNTFYFVSGEHLVPASRIIQGMISRRSEGISDPKFTVSGLKAPTAGDEYYEQRREEDRRPNFVDYWDPIRYLGFGKGAELGVNTANVSLYNSLLAGVSINTEFNINAIIASINKGGFTSIFPR